MILGLSFEISLLDEENSQTMKVVELFIAQTLPETNFKTPSFLTLKLLDTEIIM
jgi:hypothetical protein